MVLSGPLVVATPWYNGTAGHVSITCAKLVMMVITFKLTNKQKIWQDVICSKMTTKTDKKNSDKVANVNALWPYSNCYTWDVQSLHLVWYFSKQIPTQMNITFSTSSHNFLIFPWPFPCLTLITHYTFVSFAWLIIKTVTKKSFIYWSTFSVFWLFTITYQTQ